MLEHGVSVNREAIIKLLDDPARAAVAKAAQERVQPNMTVGLGSGRALWATIELLTRRDDLPGVAVIASSSVTERLAEHYGFNLATLDGDTTPDLYLDGADEVAPDLGLLKGHGAALLREKLLAVASDRFVVVSEAAKRVERLGHLRTLPVEVVRFGWADTRRRLRRLFGQVSVRTEGRTPLITDEGNMLLDVAMPDDIEAATVAARLEATVGVIEHGLFLGYADDVLLGHVDGRVELLQRAQDAVRAPD